MEHARPRARFGIDFLQFKGKKFVVQESLPQLSYQIRKQQNSKSDQGYIKGFPLGGSSAKGGDEGNESTNPLIRLLRSHLPPRGKALCRSPPQGQTVSLPFFSLCNMIENILTYAVKILVDLQIGIPKNTNTARRQIFIAHAIILLPLFTVMLASIQLDRKFGGGTIKIKNILTYHFLSAHCFGKRFQKIIPKMTFFLRHVLPQRTGKPRQRTIFISHHSHSLGRLRSIPLLHAGRKSKQVEERADFPTGVY